MSGPSYLKAVGELEAGPELDDDDNVVAIDGDGRPRIIVNDRELHELRTDTIDAILKAQEHEPVLFVRDGHPVVVSIDEDERPSIRPANIATLRNAATDAATYVTRVRNNKGVTVITKVVPPKDTIEAVAAARQPWPPLRSVVECPTLREDGTVIGTAGYDVVSGIYFADRTGDKAIAPQVQVPENPTREDVERARDDLLGLICDFPFVDQASTANMMALLVLPVVRTAIDSATPIHVIDAPVPGSGKSLLATLTGVISEGRLPEMQSIPSTGEEWRKAITSALAEGQRLVSLDNVVGPLDTPYLAQVLTERNHADRRLGTNTTIRVPNNSVWLVTGNGIQLRGDLPRRAIWVRLDPRTARPWERGGFRFPNVVREATTNRPKYLGAILTLARAWFAAGQPDPTIKPLGSFERWTTVIGGILEYAGVPGFMGNAEEAWAEGDGEVTDMAALLSRIAEWRATEKSLLFRASDLSEKFSPDIADRRDWLDVCPPEWTTAADGRGAGLNRLIGDTFKTIAGRRWDDNGLRITKTDKKDRTKAVLWLVESDADL